MLTIAKGYDPRYLTDAVAPGREGYYTDAVVAGEPPGRWYGRGAQTLGLAGTVDANLLEAVFCHRLDPRHEATHEVSRWGEAPRLGRAPNKYRSTKEIYVELLKANPDAGPERRAALRREAEGKTQQSVAFYDLTFSPSKTVTTTWAGCAQAAHEARGRGDVQGAAWWSWAARQVEEAVLDGARAGLDYAEAEACYARTGHHGGGAGMWVKGRGFTVAQFLQHDTRNGDPQLHVHQGVHNLIECPDGKYRAVDGAVLGAAKRAIAAVSERAAEASLFRRLGVAVATRPDGIAREVLGADVALAEEFSSRHRDIVAHRETVIARFAQRYGREPTAQEYARIDEQSFLATRKPKSHTAVTHTEQVARWDAQSRTVRVDGLAGEARAILALAQTARPAETWTARDVIARALAAAGDASSKWTRWELLRHVSDALPGHLDLAPEQVRVLLEGLTDAALDHAERLTPEEPTVDLPAPLVREDGSSAYARPGAVFYATKEQIVGEGSLRTALAARGAAAVSVEHANAVIARYAESGRELGADQAAALRGVLTSGAQVEVLIAAAGTGKSFVVAAIGDAWAAEARAVVGLAPSQIATAVLADDGMTARNTARWLAAQRRLAAGYPLPGDEELRLHADDLVVVDEAAATTNRHLVEINERRAAAGAKLLLVGDPAQGTAVGAGGALADLAGRGLCYHLDEVRRFREGWEGPASLRLREGDVDVLGEYAKHGRLVDGGTPDEAMTKAARAWLADTRAGRESLLLVGTNEAADQVSAQLREELVRLRLVEPGGVWVAKHHTTVGTRDLVQARRNAWHLARVAGNTTSPVNRTSYRVLSTTVEGGLEVAQYRGHDETGAEQLGPRISLPAGYVAEHVALAYASTIDAAQGQTVDTAHAVIGAATNAHKLYPAATRGRAGNHLYVATRPLNAGDETGQALDVPATTAGAVLAGILESADRESALEQDRGALAYAEHASEQAASTVRQVDRLAAEVTGHTTSRAGEVLDRLTATGVLSPTDRARVAADEHYPSLVALLRTAELAGHDPGQILATAAAERSLDGARSAADVLHARITTALHGELWPQLHAYADLLPRDMPADYAALWQRRVAAADERRHELGARLAQDPPEWAREWLGPVPGDELRAALWEHRAGWAASYAELVGHTGEANPLSTPPPARDAEKVAVWRTAREAFGMPDAAATNPAHALSEGALRARVAAAERAKDWAPAYVAEQLDATSQRHQLRQADAILWAEHVAVTADPVERDRLAAAAAEASREAAQLREQLEQLHVADEARGEWVVHTAVTRDLAETAKIELGERGINLNDPAGRTTAREHLDDQAHDDQTAIAADSAVLRVEDEHRAVTDDVDLADVVEQRAAALAQVEPEPVDQVDTVVPDGREHLDRHSSEDADRRRRDQIPGSAETDALIERARIAVAVLAAQRQADTAREAAEEARREQLAQWAADDQARAEEHEHSSTAGSSDDDLVRC